MDIWVSGELICIKEELNNRGYKVTSQRNNLHYDAIICDLKNIDLAQIVGQISVKKEGVLIIDSGSKSIDEIEYILNNRVCSGNL